MRHALALDTGEGYPVFLYIGGEGPQAAPSDRLFMYELAKTHGALMLALEVRRTRQKRGAARAARAARPWTRSQAHPSSPSFRRSPEAPADRARGRCG